MTPGRTIATNTPGTPEWHLSRVKDSVERLDVTLHVALPGCDLEALQYIFDERHRAKKRIERAEREVQRQSQNSLHESQAEFSTHRAEFLRIMHEGHQ